MIRSLALPAAAVLAAVQMAGCPGGGGDPSEFVLGSAGDQTTLAAVASVQVVAPVSDLAISGGTPVEVAWRAVATTRIAELDIIIDPDTNPDNGNEIFVREGIPLTESTDIIDTSDLEAGDYFIGVLLREIGEVTAFDYAQGRITINQRPVLFFTSPRDNFEFNRSNLLNPRFDVAWTVSDPDSVVFVQILLDPDATPNGNEILLRESTSQTGDSFSFNLPTSNFAAGTYRLLALVSDGVETFAFYAPGSIKLLARLAGMIDLRDMHLPTSTVHGAVFEGFNPRDNAGSLVASATDIDDDGFGDFLITAQFGKPRYNFNLERTGIGEAYLIYGRRDRFSGLINLNSTGTLFRGELYGGPPEQSDPIRPSRGITSFDVMSDWDNDGVRELAFGVPFTDSLSIAGFFGTVDPTFAAPLDPNGYFRTGAVVIAAGSSLRPDLGFPGRNVFILSEFGTLSHEPGEPDPPCAEGFYGPHAASTPVGYTLFHRHLADINGTPNDGSVRLGCRFTSNDFGDNFGEDVSDYDFDSIIFSVPNRDPVTNTLFNFTRGISLPGAGVISVYFVSASTGFFPWETVQAPAASEEFGYPGSAPSPAFLPHGGPYHYVVDDMRTFLGTLGDPEDGGLFTVPLQGSPGYINDHSSPCGSNPDIAFDICLPHNTTRIWGGTAGARLGGATSVEDFNADGLRDILVGSPFSNDGRGACFIVLGRVRELVKAGELPIEELGLPLNAPPDAASRIFDGIRVIGGPGDRLGQSQDSAGDFNNDGISDVIIGSPLVNNRRGGAAVFFGSREVINLTESEIPFDELPARGLGVVFVGEAEGDLAGARVAGCGDIDGDGNDDVLIAAPDRSVTADLNLDGVIDVERTNCGVVYLVYGSPEIKGTLDLSRVGTSELPGAVFVGRNSGDFLGAGLGEQGDRSRGIAGVGDVDGDGRNDLLLGSVAASPRGGRVRAGEAYLIYGEGD